MGMQIVLVVVEGDVDEVEDVDLDRGAEEVRDQDRIRDHLVEDYPKGLPLGKAKTRPDMLGLLIHLASFQIFST